MKKSIGQRSVFTIFLLAFIANSLLAQTIRRVNNNPTITGVNMYSTIQDAHDAAAAGDIIYIDASNDGTHVGNVTCTKRLTIIGTGYMLLANANTLFDKRPSKVGNISFNAGSAMSQLVGVSVTGVAMADNNITVSRCFVSSNGFNYIIGNNCTIKNCFITSSINSSSMALNLLITGNIIYQPEQWAINGITNTIVANNIIYSEVTGYFGSGNPLKAPIQNANNCSIINNIFDLRNATSISAQAIGCSNIPCATSNTISNNICLTRNGLPADNGNVNAANATATFQVINPWDGYSIYNKIFTEDAIFKLATSSPAIGIGTGNTDAGVFGGVSPYVLSGLPPYPIITNFNTTGAGNINTPIQVNVTVRSNN